jgi:hypothetical protein
LVLDLDERGVPTGKPGVDGCEQIPAEGPSDGAVIDCSGLPPSRLQYSCLVAGDQSAISNLTICNGAPPFCTDPLQPYTCDGRPFPGGVRARHRNAIRRPPGNEAVVEEVHVVNARRGVLLSAGSGQATRGTVRRSLIDGTELAGFFVWTIEAVDPGGLPVDGARLHGEFEANRLSRIGRFPFIQEWSWPDGRGNRSHIALRDNIVDSTNFFGVNVIGLGNGANQDNRATFDVEGGRLEGQLGLYITTGGDGDDNSNNLVRGNVRGVTIKNSQPDAVLVDLQPGWGTGNRVLLKMEECTYVGEGKGVIEVFDDAGSDFRFLETQEEFAASNINFDISGVLSQFADDGSAP